MSLFDALLSVYPCQTDRFRQSPTPTISSNYNAVFHQHRWRCSACRLAKKQAFHLLLAQRLGWWSVAYWWWSASTALKKYYTRCRAVCLLGLPTTFCMGEAIASLATFTYYVFLDIFKTLHLYILYLQELFTTWHINLNKWLMSVKPLGMA